MTTDKTGAPTTVTQDPDRFSISVEGQKAGFTEFIDRDGQRVFTHTEVADEFGGRWSTANRSRRSPGQPWPETW